MTLQQSIEKIISENIKSGDYFDSHTIINELRNNKEFALDYIKGLNNETDIKEYHKNISVMISNVSGIEKISESLKSHSIFGNIVKNSLWKKR